MEAQNLLFFFEFTKKDAENQTSPILTTIKKSCNHSSSPTFSRRECTLSIGLILRILYSWIPSNSTSGQTARQLVIRRYSRTGLIVELHASTQLRCESIQLSSLSERLESYRFDQVFRFFYTRCEKLRQKFLSVLVAGTVWVSGGSRSFVKLAQMLKVIPQQRRACKRSKSRYVRSLA